MNPAIWIFSVVGGMALILVVAWLIRRRKPKEEIHLYFRCPGCKRKLKYHARQAGHHGMCATCKAKFVFPHPELSRR